MLRFMIIQELTVTFWYMKIGEKFLSLIHCVDKYTSVPKTYSSQISLKSKSFKLIQIHLFFKVELKIYFNKYCRYTD